MGRRRRKTREEEQEEEAEEEKEEEEEVGVQGPKAARRTALAGAQPSASCHVRPGSTRGTSPWGTGARAVLALALWLWLSALALPQAEQLPPPLVLQALLLPRRQWLVLAVPLRLLLALLLPRGQWLV